LRMLELNDVNQMTAVVVEVWTDLSGKREVEDPRNLRRSFGERFFGCLQIHFVAVLDKSVVKTLKER
jgi:hypothetical protein